MIPISDRISMGLRKCMVAHGSIGRLKRTKPYVPIFSRTPARMTEPAGGASTCAAGSRVWRGNIGTLMEQHTKKARNDQYCKAWGKPSVCSARARRECNLGRACGG